MAKRALFLAVLLALSASAAGAPVIVTRESKALDFNYQWPAEAASVPSLQRHLQSDMTKALRQARSDAEGDAKQARANHYPFRRHSYSLNWELAGQTDRLLSLRGDLGFDTNGAHPNSATKALLWDRKLGNSVTVSSLFARSADLATITRAQYCRALDAERLKRREGERLTGEFAQCPKYGELAIIPDDRDHDGRFDRLLFVASPYVAGPYFEGEYQVVERVSPRLMRALKPVYRSSFETQPQ